MTKTCRLIVRGLSHTGPRWKHWATNHGDEKESDFWIAPRLSLPSTITRRYQEHIEHHGFFI